MNAIGKSITPADPFPAYLAAQVAAQVGPGARLLGSEAGTPGEARGGTDAITGASSRPTSGPSSPETPDATGQGIPASTKAASATPEGAGSQTASSAALSAQDQAVVAELKRIDTQVRNHEMAHVAAGAGVVTGGPSFTYRKGPDGAMYAVGGEVPISFSPEPDDPAATVRKAEQVQRAALAPADPSTQDRAVAAAANAVATQARASLHQQNVQAFERAAASHTEDAPVTFAPARPASPSDRGAIAVSQGAPPVPATGSGSPSTASRGPSGGDPPATAPATRPAEATERAPGEQPLTATDRQSFPQSLKGEPRARGASPDPGLDVRV